MELHRQGVNLGFIEVNDLVNDLIGDAGPLYHTCHGISREHFCTQVVDLVNSDSACYDLLQA